jgi:Tfp pilus assembly protein FimT
MVCNSPRGNRFGFYENGYVSQSGIKEEWAMRPHDRVDGNFIYCSKGFTVNELLMAIIIMSVLCMFMTPALMDLRESLVCKEATRIIVSTLRAARVRAIATNREHKVEFEPVNGRYRIIQGNRASDSIDWNTIIQDWAFLPTGVNVRANVAAIHLNSNGTASGGTVNIQNSERATKYRVVVASTGRIRVK